MSSMRLLGVLAAVFLAAPATGAPSAASPSSKPSVEGEWITQSGNLAVAIAPCGQALCGTVSRVLGNRSMADPAKAMSGPEPAVGLLILSDLEPVEDGGFKGRILNRENGKTYDCRISLQPDDVLKVRAYRLMPLFGKTQVWTRATAAPSKPSA